MFESNYFLSFACIISLLAGLASIRLHVRKPESCMLNKYFVLTYVMSSSLECSVFSCATEKLRRGDDSTKVSRFPAKGRELSPISGVFLFGVFIGLAVEDERRDGDLGYRRSRS